VSTSAQATLGGMAGNNSCGSRSIAYGNMVHNVLGIDAILTAAGRTSVRSVASATADRSGRRAPRAARQARSSNWARASGRDRSVSGRA
jgi:FAD/FMN-containing dehydrogenase